MPMTLVMGGLQPKDPVNPNYGGCNPDKVKSGEMIASSTMYCLNIESGEWAEKAEMHCCCSHHNLVEYDGKICAIGERDDNGRWINRPPFRCPRAYASCVVAGKNMWLVGGASKDSSHEVLVWDQLTNIMKLKHDGNVRQQNEQSSPFCCSCSYRYLYIYFWWCQQSRMMSFSKK